MLRLRGCPRCFGTLSLTEDEWKCLSCGRTLPEEQLSHASAAARLGVTEPELRRRLQRSGLPTRYQIKESQLATLRRISLDDEEDT